MFTESPFLTFIYAMTGTVSSVFLVFDTHVRGDA